MAALSIKSTKTKYSPNMATILEQTAQMLGGDPAATEQAMMAGAQGGGQSPKSKALKFLQILTRELNNGYRIRIKSWY